MMFFQNYIEVLISRYYFDPEFDKRSYCVFFERKLKLILQIYL